MKIFSQPYKLIAQYLFICLVITSTKSQQSQYKYFNYTESTGTLGAPPLVADIKTYDDGTLLVHIIRNDSTQSSVDCLNIQGMSLEQNLYMRIIHLNGSVKEINPNLNLHPVNYCLLNSNNTEYKINKRNNFVTYLKETQNNNTNILHNIINPITIYPLQKQFILITYVKTKNSSNITAYEEWADVVDWNGNIRSTMHLGAWINSTIQLNINKKLGFLRFDSDQSYWRWRQYFIDDSGNLTSGDKTQMKTTDSMTLYRYSNSPITIISTVDNGYIIVTVFDGTLESDNSDLLLPRGGLYAFFIPYNDNYTGTDIYQISQPNMTISSVYCDTTDIYIICIVAVNSNITTHYVSISFDSSGVVHSRKVISDLPNVTGLSQQSWSAKILPFGGFILGLTAYNNIDNNTYHYIYAYGVNNSQIPLKSSGPFLTNYFGANSITNNNTFILASPYANDNISWSLLTIPVPTGNIHNIDYGYDNTLVKQTIPSINSTVNSSTTTLNITFVYNIALSTGNITIYKASDNSIRQRISATMQEFCKIDGYTVSIKIINNTFNEHGEQYFVTMDNNFVKRVQTNEPLKGIHDGIWILNSDNFVNPNIYSDAIMGSVRLTTDASKSFLGRNQSAYINTLLDEFADKVPIHRSRLSTNYKFEVLNDQIAIPIRIDMARNKTEKSSSKAFSDLNNMITYKNITTFSSGMTNDLDQDYGFGLIEIIRNYGNEYKVQIITGFIIFIIFYLILNYKFKSKIFEAISSAILGLPNFILSVYFVIYYSDDVPELYYISVLHLSISLFTNFHIAISTISRGFKDAFIGEFYKKNPILIAILTIILTPIDYEFLTILKYAPIFPIFTKRIYRYEQINRLNIHEDIFEDAIKCGAIVDIIKNSLQICIQVHYYKSNYILVYHLVPLLLLIMSCLKISIIIFNYVYKKINLIIIHLHIKGIIFMESVQNAINHIFLQPGVYVML
ncbi:hypothetical protein C2G38_1694379 [Gigaspora rosea]|uniref:Uncharacterized protein n=1 Tax=Gigaspora rosea TaxID=44941 RepID=A0A397W381_9GLOM|nr:hypothetical protein C2G38_1694379 [Gigaspora rosea]